MRPEVLRRPRKDVCFQFDASGRYTGSSYFSSVTEGVDPNQLSEPCDEVEDGGAEVDAD